MAYNAHAWRMRRLKYLRETGRHTDPAIDWSGLEQRAAALVTNEQAEEKQETASASMPDMQLDRVGVERRQSAGPANRLTGGTRHHRVL